jgi:hypothetical protein
VFEVMAKEGFVFREIRDLDSLKGSQVLYMWTVERLLRAIF